MRWFSLLVWAGEMNAILLRLLAGRKFRNLPEIVPNYLYRSALKAADRLSKSMAYSRARAL